MSDIESIAAALGWHRELAWNHKTGMAICADCDEALGPLTAEIDEQDRWLRDHQARAITAAGYRKPRVVTTTEELDALPVGSVVLRNGRAFQRFAPRPAAFGEYRMWKCTDGGYVRSTNDGSSILPATVIYDPEAK